VFGSGSFVDNTSAQVGSPGNEVSGLYTPDPVDREVVADVETPPPSSLENLLELTSDLKL